MRSMSTKKNFDRFMQGLGEAADYASGKAARRDFRVHVPDAVDVKAIRKKHKLTQAAFAERYGFTLGVVRDWEQGRRQPEAATRFLLKVIENRPDFIADVLAA